MADQTFLEQALEGLKSNSPKSALKELEFLRLDSEYRPRSVRVGRGSDALSFTLRWLRSFYPFQTESRIICSEFFDTETQTSFFVTLADRAIEINDHLMNRSFQTIVGQRAMDVFFSLSLKEEASSNWQLTSYLDKKISLFFKLALTPSQHIDSTTIDTRSAEALTLFRNDFAESLKKLKDAYELSPTLKSSQQIKAILVCLPRNESYRTSPPTPARELKPFEGSFYHNEGISIFTSASKNWRHEPYDYLRSQRHRKGFFELQFLLANGRLIVSHDPLELKRYGLDLDISCDPELDDPYKKERGISLPAWVEEGRSIKQDHLSKLALLKALSQQKEYPLYLADGYNTADSRYLWLIQSVQFDTAATRAVLDVQMAPPSGTSAFNFRNDPTVELVQRSLGRTAITLRPLIKQKSDVIANELFFSFDGGQLTVHSLYALFEALDDLSEQGLSIPYTEQINKSCLVGKALTTVMTLEIAGHEFVAQRLESLRTHLQSAIDKQALTTMPLEFHRLAINAEATSFQFYVEYRDPNKKSSDDAPKILISNFTHWWMSHLLGLKDGFSGILSSAAKDDIAGRYRAKRPLNLKFLRHAGAFAFVLHSTLRWVFSDPKSRSKLKDLIADIHSKLILLVAPEEAQAAKDPSLKNVFNQAIASIVNKLIEHIVKTVEPHNATDIYLDSKAYRCAGLHYHQAKIIYFILDRIAHSTQGELFRSGKNKHTEFWSDCVFAEDSPWLKDRFRSLAYCEGRSYFSYEDIEPEIDPDGAEDDSFDSSASEDDDLFDDDFSDRPSWLDPSPYSGNFPLVLPGPCAFTDEKSLAASPVNLRYRIPAKDYNDKKGPVWLLQNWPQFQSQFEASEVSIKGLNIEVLEPEAFQVRFGVSTTSGASPLAVNSEFMPSRTPINWFELHPEYFLKGKPITMVAAQGLVNNGIVEHDGQFYVIDIKKLPTHRSLEMFWSKLSAKAGNKDGFSFEGGRGSKDHKTPRHHILELLALRKMGIPFTGPTEWQEVCNYFDALSEPPSKSFLSPQLETVLKPYQKIGFQWLWDLYHLKMGGILADDMGLGKTLQTLAFIDSLRHNKKPHRSVVVVPVSLVYNWMSEAQKFTPQLRIDVFDPARTIYEDVDILVCTYGLLALHEEKLSSAQFDLAFFDEAQNLKNRNTDRFEAAEKLASPLKIALTGTPLENHLGNLYALMAVVVPGALGSFADFSRMYIKNTNLTPYDLDYLKAQLKPLILRRTKEQILKELPPKTETELKIEFTKKQKDLYKKTALAYSEKISSIIAKEGEARSQLHMLTALLRLRQICSDPSALPGLKYNELPPKIETLFDRLEQVLEEGHSAIVFTQFMSTYDRITKLAKERKLSLLSLCGSDSSKQRTKTLAAFNENEQPAILLMTLKTGGVGLNLTKASYVFHLEPWWNPAVENQATDRVHRIGQDKPISVYRMIMRESVEEKVEILKARKGSLFNQMFGEAYFSSEASDVDGTEAEVATKSGRLAKADFDVLLS